MTIYTKTSYFLHNFDTFAYKKYAILEKKSGEERSMFGSKRIGELESRVSELRRKLDVSASENARLTQELDSARRRIADLETELVNQDVEQARKDLETARVEYEGMKEMYARKIAEFDASREEREAEFARVAAVERFNLDKEISENRKASEEYVSSTVRTFSDSYNYYLSQIRLLINALGDVASQTGEKLFSEPNDDLKARIGTDMAATLKAELDPLRTESGDLMLIGTDEEAEGHVILDEAVIAEAAPDTPAPAKPAPKKPAEKKPAAKKPAAKKPAEKKPAAKKPAAKKPAAKKAAASEENAPAEEAPKAEIPAAEEALKAEIPAVEEALKAEIPAAEEAPKAEIPAAEEAPKAEIPATEEALKAEIPAAEEAVDLVKEKAAEGTEAVADVPAPAPEN